MPFENLTPANRAKRLRDRDSWRMSELVYDLGLDDCYSTGDDGVLDFVYRAPDLTVSWSGGGAFVVIPREGQIRKIVRASNAHEIRTLVTAMTRRGQHICREIADEYRRRHGETAGDAEADRRSLIAAI